MPKAFFAVFMIAKSVLPKLQLPVASIEYYAQLINYYNGVRLKQLNEDTIQLYLLCYSYSRFQMVNDNLLEAFKKRTNQYVAEANEVAKTESSNFLDELDKVRHKVHGLIMAIKNDPHKTHIKKAKLYKYVPESELDITAQILISNKLDKNHLYWRHIDKNERSIALNLRSLFLNLDITILRLDKLKNVVSFMKQFLGSDNKATVPKYVIDWVPKNDRPYILKNNDPIANRIEFFMYKQLAHHIDTNKLILKYSIQHKQIEDNFMELPRWKKEKPKILRSLPYPKLQAKSPQSFLEKKERDLREMYQKVNADINSGVNE